VEAALRKPSPLLDEVYAAKVQEAIQETRTVRRAVAHAGPSS